jgi:hypothetical protein
MVFPHARFQTRDARKLPLALALALGFFGIIAPASAQAPRQEPDWPTVKCERYTKSYNEALAKYGKRGLGQAFLENHDAFLASGCTAPGNVCPRSTEELNLANVLVILSMNQGMASTFAPFSCRK